MTDLCFSLGRLCFGTATVLLWSFACAQTAPVASYAGLVRRARDAMGSELRLTAWTADKAGAISAFDAIYSEFDRLEALMSIWIQESDIVRRTEVVERLPLINYRDVGVDERAGTVFLRRKGMCVHLGGIGEGYNDSHR